MAWLLRRGEVLASVILISSPASLSRELDRKDHLEGAVLVQPCRRAHSLGIRAALDVAYIDQDLNVFAVSRTAPFRLSLPRLRAVAVLHAEAGAFERWRLRPGDTLEIKN